MSPAIFLTVPSFRRLFVASLITIAALAVASPQVQAGDESWVYRRSYFSHVLPPEVQARYPIPESRSAYRLPLVNESPGFSVRSVYRYNPIEIYDGRSTDTTIYSQFWIQFQQ